MGDFSVKAVLSAVDKNFSSTMKSALGYTNNLKDTLTSGIGFGAMMAIGQKAVSVVGSGLSSLAKGSLNAGMSFESAMSSVAAISGSSASELERLTSKAQEMGATTKFSATEAANAMEYMAMAGWKADDMMNGISGIMNLAAASGADLARTSDIVTDALTAFNRTAADSVRFADVMAAASANANTNVELMGETFKYVGAAAGAMGYSIEDIAVATGLMANSGIKGSEAGTALRSTITRLAKPTKESQTAMKALGITLTDSSGNMRSFGDIMQDMRKSMKGMNSEQKAAYAAMLGGQEAMSGLLAIANSSDEDFDKLTKAINGSKNAAEEMAKIKLDNLQGDVTILQSSIEGLGITIFNQVGGSLRGLVGTATEVVGKINDKLSEGKGIEKFIGNVQKYWKILKSDAIEVGNAFGDAVQAIVGEVRKLTNAFGSAESIASFSDILGTAAGGLKTFAGFCEEHADIIAKVITLLPKLYVGYKGFKIVKAVAPFVGAFTGAIGGLAKMGLRKLIPNLFGVAKGQEEVGKSSGSSSKKMLASAKSFLMLGIGILAVSTGFYLLAQSAVNLANAGPVAIGVMVGMVGAVTVLGTGMIKAVNSMKGSVKKLNSIAGVFMAIGASILLISASFWILSDAAVRLAEAGPLAVGAMAGLIVGLGALLIVAKSVAPALTAGAVGFVAFGGAMVLAGAGMMIMTSAAISLANAGPLAIGVMVGMIAAIALLAAGAAALGPALTIGAVGFVAFGAAILLVGAGALLASAGVALLAQSLPLLVAYGLQGSMALTALGLGMTVFAIGAGIAGAAAAVLGAGLAIAAVGIAAVGVAVGVLGVGMMLVATSTLLASAGVALLATQLPVIAAYGMQGALAIAALGAGMIIFAAGAGAAGVACIALGAGLTVVAVGLGLVGAAVLVTAAGVITLAVGALALGAGLMLVTAALTGIAVLLPVVSIGTLLIVATFTALLAISAGLSVTLIALTAAMAALAVGAAASGVAVSAFALAMTTGAAGTLVMAAALKAVKSSMKSIAKNAKAAQTALEGMRSSVKVVESGLDALGSKAKSAMNKFVNAFSGAVGQAQSAGKSVANGIKNGVQSGLNPLPNIATTTMGRFNSGLRSGGNSAKTTARNTSSAIVSSLRSASSGSYSCGYYIGTGLANGMAASLGRVRSVAAQMAAAAEAAIRAKAKIHSPSRVSGKLGEYWGTGWVNGILDKAKAAKKAAEQLVNIPDIPEFPDMDLAFAGGYGGHSLKDDYNYEPTVYVRVEVPVDLDGREVAKVTTPYVMEEQDKIETRNNRKKGYR